MCGNECLFVFSAGPVLHLNGVSASHLSLAAAARAVGGSLGATSPAVLGQKRKQATQNLAQ